MLCMQCRRIAASALRQASTAARTNPINRSPIYAPARNSILATSREIRSPHGALRYSTASNTAADSANPLYAILPEKPDYLNDAESAIWDRLVAEFSPTNLIVRDISGGCGTMYGIEIESEKFRGIGMLKQQRMVNAVLGDDVKKWHGIQLRTKTP
ncbi:bola-like protein [Xylaria nigripes]|nr:bola-like protein [Xylaria nigripes]